MIFSSPRKKLNFSETSRNTKILTLVGLPQVKSVKIWKLSGPVHYEKSSIVCFRTMGRHNESKSSREIEIIIRQFLFPFSQFKNYFQKIYYLVIITSLPSNTVASSEATVLRRICHNTVNEHLDTSVSFSKKVVSTTFDHTTSQR